MQRSLILGLFLLPFPAWAQDGKTEGTEAPRTVRARDGETVSLKLRVAEPGKNFLTVVTLPDPVAHVVSAWDPKDLSVEQEGKKLFLKLLSKAEGHLDIVTAGGAHVRLLILPAPASDPADSNVEVRLAPREAHEEKTSHRAGASGALLLVKAMRLGEVPPDATVRSGVSETLYSSTAIDIALLSVYETGRFRGYVLSLANKSDTEAYHVDVSRLQGERLVLVGAKDVVVHPRKSTRLYVVDWK